MKTKSIMELRGVLDPAPHQSRTAELAESLRAMHRAAMSHYSPAGGLPRVAVVMEEWRLSHLIHAANALDPEPGPCDMGPICIGCTPRVGNACPGAARPLPGSISPDDEIETEGAGL